MSVRWKVIHESDGDSRVVEDTPARLLVAEGLSPQVAELLAAAPDLLALVREMQPLVFEYAMSVGCDHTVGICACGLKATARAAQELLARIEGGGK